MTRRTIKALRALAERPGTVAEGIAARELLDRLKVKSEPKAPVESPVEAAQETPSAFEYFMSDYGRALSFVLSVLIAWLGPIFVRWLIGL